MRIIFNLISLINYRTTDHTNINFHFVYLLILSILKKCSKIQNGNLFATDKQTPHVQEIH